MVDFVYWNITEVGGWRVEHLPIDVLANLWEDISKRRMVDANLQNHSAAMLAGIDQAKAAKSEKVDPKPWLPYDLSRLGKPQAKATVIEKLKGLRTENKLPAAMLRDLYKAKLLEPEK